MRWRWRRGVLLGVLRAWMGGNWTGQTGWVVWVVVVLDVVCSTPCSPSRVNKVNFRSLAQLAQQQFWVWADYHTRLATQVVNSLYQQAT